MNYLAHAFLSFNNSDILFGNMISDFVKGKQQFTYSVGVQKGIQLHRAIDAFTDKHISTKEAKLFFKPAVGAYAGAFVDVVYDYFLANDTTYFTATSLAFFAEKTYKMLSENSFLMPSYFATIFPYMQQQNWLYNYQFDWGIEKSFEGVARRARYLQTSAWPFAIFVEQKANLQLLYSEFIKDIVPFVQNEIHTTYE